MPLLRLGKIDYLNCFPLFYPLEKGEIPLKARFIRGYPSQLKGLLERGEVDLTPLSSWACRELRDKILIMPSLSISCWGRVKSVLLWSKVPVEDLEGQPLSLTSQGFTSVALLQLLCRRYYRINPTFFYRPPSQPPFWRDPPALLTIGDEALGLLSSPSSLYPFVYDLGETWWKWTGRPMVFALWALSRAWAQRHPEEAKRIWQALMEAKRRCRRDIKRLAELASAQTGLDEGLIREYWRHIDYELDEEHREGLNLFYNLGRREGLTAEKLKIAFGGDFYGEIVAESPEG
ncbi:MAG TPA: ABC transporter substrate-binding protein [Moorella mulderi]|nr:ABC transporter substrate-binding protein [Moorella mulderi]